MLLGIMYSPPPPQRFSVKSTCDNIPVSIRSQFSTRISLDLFFLHAFVAKYQPHLVQIITVIMVYLLLLHRTVEDTLKLQKDIDLLGSWARKWGMRFRPVKCNMMQLTNKRINKIEASYTLEGTVLENVNSIKYLGVTITNDLKWNTHINNICTKANRTLGFLEIFQGVVPRNVVYMRFQPVKCNMMQLTNKQININDASYTLECTILEKQIVKDWYTRSCNMEVHTLTLILKACGRN